MTSIPLFKLESVKVFGKIHYDASQYASYAVVGSKQQILTSTDQIKAQQFELEKVYKGPVCNLFAVVVTLKSTSLSHSLQRLVAMRDSNIDPVYETLPSIILIRMHPLQHYLLKTTARGTIFMITRATRGD